MGSRLLFFSTPLQRKRESKKTVVVFCWGHNCDFGPSGCRGVEKSFLHDFVVIDEIKNLSKTISGSLIFAVTKFVASTQNHTPTMVPSENHDFAKSIAGAAARMPARTLAEQQQYT